MSASRLDRDPTPDAHAEWLVITTGCDAAIAVSAARERGIRVDHLQLEDVDTDDMVASAAARAKHVIVAESTGRLAASVQRLLPHIGVVPVTGDAPAEQILHRLLHTPRCC